MRNSQGEGAAVWEHRGITYLRWIPPPEFDIVVGSEHTPGTKFP